MSDFVFAFQKIDGFEFVKIIERLFCGKSVFFGEIVHDEDNVFYFVFFSFHKPIISLIVL